MAESKSKQFVGGLTSDPVERGVLLALLNAIRNKRKIMYTATEMKRHSPISIAKTDELLQLPTLHKSFYTIVMKKIRYQEPDEYAAWIQDMLANHDEALELRSRFRPMQTYSSIGDYIAGLSKFNVELTANQKTCLLAANYVMISTQETRDSEEEFIYNHQERYVRLKDSDLVEFIVSHPDDALAIKVLITDRLLLRPAELSAALDNGTSSLINGSL